MPISCGGSLGRGCCALLRCRRRRGVSASTDVDVRRKSDVLTMPRQCPECGAAAGEPHIQPCSFHQRYEAASGPLVEWLASLPAEYERLKARAAGNHVANVGFDEVA